VEAASLTYVFEGKSSGSRLLTSHRDSLAIFDRLAQSDPSNAGLAESSVKN